MLNLKQFQRNKLQNKKAGFTLIEVVLVLAIGGLIFLLAFVAFSQVQRNRRDSERRAFLNTFVAELTNYYQENASYPVSIGPLTSNNGNSINIPNKDEATSFPVHNPTTPDSINMKKFVDDQIIPLNNGDPSEEYYRLARTHGVYSRTGDIHYNSEYGRCNSQNISQRNLNNDISDIAVSIMLENGRAYCRNL